jgi:integrase
VIRPMPRPRPPHLHREISRHGKVTWCVRIDKGKRVRLRADYGTPEFTAEYHAALTSQPRRTCGPASGTLAWLIARYRETPEWRVLSSATRRQRENIFLHVLETAGDQPFGKITRATIVAGRERRASTPAQARNFLDAMRGLFRWAANAGLVKSDPTQGVTNPPRKKGPGFIPWTEDHVAVYERSWPLGTRQRVWLDVLLYTGLRRGDAVRLGRQHVRDGICTIKTEKSGFTVEVTIPILPVLKIDAGRRPVWRPCIYRRRERRAAHEGVVRQPVSRGVQRRRRARLGTRRPQNRGDPRRQRRRDRGAARSYLRLAGRHHGVALHPRRRPPAARDRGHAQAQHRPK